MITDAARRQASIFAALGHEARVKIVHLLNAAHPDGLVVSEIQSRLDIPGSTLSHHLEALRRVELISATREGRFLRYRAVPQQQQALLDFLQTECRRYSPEARPAARRRAS